ncbi:MAG: neutral zinc metallopeptidase [Thermomicrobiales bacterium]|nr:neutral zinc metallopeptidase [Thermomicrobiales bacterium]
MLRRLLVPIVALLALAMPFAALAQSAPETVAADLNAYWAARFAEAGFAYSPPGLRMVTDSTVSACGPIDPSIGPAAYCPADSTIYYAPIWDEIYQTGGNPYAWFVVLAHEWGHHVQHLLATDDHGTQGSELQADCLAGAFVRDAEDRGLAEPGTLTRGMGLAIKSGDLPFINDPEAIHGSGADRGVTFMQGYMQGLSACGLPF